jgi:phage protein D
MKKLMTMLLGAALALGTVSAFAQEKGAATSPSTAVAKRTHTKAMKPAKPAKVKPVKLVKVNKVKPAKARKQLKAKTAKTAQKH